ncbi:hypothetical protein ACHAWF_017299, partial [Thalassiosira exigua]
VHERVHRRATRREEGEPPPPVILSAQLIVAQQQGDFRAGDEEDHVHGQGEAEDVVELVHPEGGHDEEELDIGGGEGNHAGERDPDNGLHEERGLRHRAGDGGGDGGKGDGVSLVSKVRAEEHKGDGDAAPHCRHDDEVQEGDAGRRPEEGQDGVEEDERGEAQPREGRGREEGAQLPLPSAEALVEAARDVSREAAAEHVEDEGGRHEGPAPRGAEESHGREADGEEGAEADLRPGPDHDAIEHGRGRGGAEDVGMHELPPRLLGLLLLLLVGEGGHLVVSRDVPPEVADEDAHDEEGEEEDHEDGVGDGVPVHLGENHVVLAEVHIPPAGPRRLRVLPRHVVGVDHVLPHSHPLERLDGRPVNVQVSLARLEGLGEALGALAVPGVPPRVLVVDGHGLHGESHHAVPVLIIRVVVLEEDVDVVVHVRLLGVAGDESDGESPRVVSLVLPGPREAHARPREVVDDPVVVVAVLDVRAEGVGLDLRQGHLAEDLAVHLAKHVDRVGGVLDLVPRQELPEVLGGHLGPPRGAAEGEAVVVFGKLPNRALSIEGEGMAWALGGIRRTDRTRTRRAHKNDRGGRAKIVKYPPKMDPPLIRYYLSNAENAPHDVDQLTWVWMEVSAFTFMGTSSPGVNSWGRTPGT